MKKNKLLICSIVILLIPVILFLYLNIKVVLNKNKNEIVLTKFNNIFKEQTIELATDSKLALPKIEIMDTDYIGIITHNSRTFSLPIESTCNNTYKSACLYSKESLIILATTLKDSLYNYKEYQVKDIISFTNSLGQTYQYRIDQIKRINNLDNLSKYNEDLIIIIKNYYDMEYILLLCNSY